MFHFIRGHRGRRHHLQIDSHGDGQHRHSEGGRHGGAGRQGGERGPKMFDAGALRYAVLQLIAEKPRHGYDVIKELELRAGGAYTPSPGAIYPLLSLLLDLGHVSAAPDGNKKLHTITAEGQAFLDQHRALVDAIFARMAAPQPEQGSDVRHLMHELKAAVIGRAHGDAPSAARLAHIRAILRRATVEIVQLD
ncbi:MAG: PadR family transcriptional regulator [Pseudomonadota bacterium]